MLPTDADAGVMLTTVVIMETMCRIEEGVRVWRSAICHMFMSSKRVRKRKREGSDLVCVCMCVCVCVCVRARSLSL